MKRKLAGIGLILAGITGGTAARASVYGPSGLVMDPTAYVSPSLQPSIGASTFTERSSGQTERWVSVVADIGILGKAEAGVTYLHTQDGGARHGTGGFGKYQLLKETLISPAISIGADVIGGDLKTQDAYLVATKQVLPSITQHPLALTAGVIAVRYRDGMRVDGADVFGGLQFRLTRGINLVGEVRSRTKGYKKDVVGAMLVFGPRRYNLALGALNNGHSDHPTFFIGAIAIGSK